MFPDRPITLPPAMGGASRGAARPLARGPLRSLTDPLRSSLWICFLWIHKP